MTKVASGNNKKRKQGNMNRVKENHEKEFLKGKKDENLGLKEN